MYFGLKSLFIDGLELLREAISTTGYSLGLSETKIVLIIHLCKTVANVMQECKNTYIKFDNFQNIRMKCLLRQLIIRNSSNMNSCCSLMTFRFKRFCN